MSDSVHAYSEWMLRDPPRNVAALRASKVDATLPHTLDIPYYSTTLLAVQRPFVAEDPGLVLC